MSSPSRLASACACLELLAVGLLATFSFTSQTTALGSQHLAASLFEDNQKLHTENKELAKRNCQLSSALERVRLGLPVPTISPTAAPAAPKTSCSAILAGRGNAVTYSQAYDLVTGNTVSRVYCHMESLGECGSGGWTTLMKVDGRETTFHFDSGFWENSTTYNEAGGATGFDFQQAKMKTYSTLPFTKLCLVFRDMNDLRLRYLAINQTASSLLAFLGGGSEYTATSRGRNTWLSSLAHHRLQQFCNKEGFNVRSTNPNSSRARMGIIGNNQRDCDNTDSAMGVGLGGNGCGCGDCDKLSAGTYHACTNSWPYSWGRVIQPAFVHIFAQ